MECSGVSVLLVDPNEGFRTAVAGMLDSLGVSRVAVASDFQGALDCLGQPGPTILLAELHLGDHDGFDLVEAAQLAHPTLSAVLMSRTATARDVEAAHSHGVVDLLSKPFSQDRLELALEKALAATHGLWGEVQHLSLSDMLQMYHYGRRTTVIHLAGERTGRIYLRRGELIHATAGNLSGIPALCHLLQGTFGVVRTEPMPAHTEHSLTGDFDGVLLECMCRIDEESRDELLLERSRAAQIDRLLETTFAEVAARRDQGDGNCQAALQGLAALDGYFGSCIADATNAEVIAAHGSLASGQGSKSSSANAEVVRSLLVTIEALGLGDPAEDILITLGTQYHLIRPIRDSGHLFLYMILDRSASNLALGRHLLASVAAEVLR